ncbi:hypothetical protein MMC12_006856 [Toensbergia leucococca]|nr:hypothetical protein [Toensbergia leucococca]
MKLSFNKVKADDLLEVTLQCQGKLYSDIIVEYMNVQFRIQVIEWKGYATEKINCEAEIQSVVSKACLVNFQQQLIYLYECGSPDAEKSKTSLVFSHDPKVHMQKQYDP